MTPRYAFESLNIFGNLDVYISFCKKFNLFFAILANQHTASVWAMLPYTPVKLAGSRLNGMWLVILMFESCKCLIRRNIFICLAAKVLPCNYRFALQRRVCLGAKGLPCGEEFASIFAFWLHSCILVTK